MPLDRGTARWLNGICVVVALGAVGGIGALLYSQKRLAESFPISPRLTSLRKIKSKAYSLVSQKKLPEAEKQFLAAIAADPHDQALHLSLGRVLLSEGKRRAAWQQLSLYAPTRIKILSLEPNLRAWFADLETEFGDPKDAEAICRITLQDDWLKPTPVGKALLARTHAYACENSDVIAPEEAVSHLSRAIELDPGAVQARVALANQFWETGKKPEANRSLDAALKRLRPHDCANAVYLAYMLNRAGRNPESNSIAQQAIDSGASKDPRLATALAQIFAGLDNKPQAFRMIEIAEAKTKSPGANTLCGFADVYRRLGQIDRAKALLHQADPIAYGNTKARVAQMLRDLDHPTPKSSQS